MSIVYNGQRIYKQGEPIDHHDIDTRHPLVVSAARYAEMEAVLAEKQRASKPKIDKDAGTGPDPVGRPGKPGKPGKPGIR